MLKKSIPGLFQYAKQKAWPCNMRGFTLVEMMVVLLLIGIILAMITLPFGDDDGSVVRDESERLALLLQTAQQEAVLAGQIIAVRVDENGYQFFQLNEKNEFQPWEQELWRPRTWSPGVAIAGTAMERETNGEIVLLPTGEMTAFSLTLFRGKARWRIDGKVHGEITLAPQV